MNDDTKVEDPELDLVMAPIVVAVNNEVKVVGHIYMKREMGELYQFWDMAPFISDAGLAYLATPKSMDG